MIILNNPSLQRRYTVTHILRKWIHQTGWKREAVFLAQPGRARSFLFFFFFFLDREDLVPKREEEDYLNKSPL